MKWRRAAAATALAAFAAALLAGFLWEPRRLTLTRVAIRDGPLARLLAGRTAALLSDLHFGERDEPAARQALHRLGELRPDLIFLAGDFVEWGGPGEAYDRALDFLEKLEAPLGVYAVLGDADRTFSRRSCEFCHRPGTGMPADRHRVAFLRDEERIVDAGRGAVRIVGIDAKSRRPYSPRIRRLLERSDPALVISHSSVVFRDLDPRRPALVLSGDTHGGQVRLPGWFWRLTRLKPDPRHLHGLFREGSKALFVTRGVGTSRLRFRLGASPELVVFAFGVAE